MPRLRHPEYASAQPPWKLRVGAMMAVVIIHAAVVASLYRTQNRDVQQVKGVEAMMVVNVLEAPMATRRAARSAPKPFQPIALPVPESRPEPESPPEIKPAPAPIVKQPPSASKQPPKLRSRPQPRSSAEPNSAKSPLLQPAQLPQAAPPSSSASGSAEMTPQPKSGRAEDEPLRVSGVEYAGKRPSPEYPRLSRERQEEGTAMVLVDIDTQGRVIKAVIDASSGYPRLDDAALRAAREARFKPYTRGGVAYPSQTKLPFVFTLKRN